MSFLGHPAKDLQVTNLDTKAITGNCSTKIRASCITSGSIVANNIVVRNLEVLDPTPTPLPPQLLSTNDTFYIYNVATGSEVGPIDQNPFPQINTSVLLRVSAFPPSILPLVASTDNTGNVSVGVSPVDGLSAFQINVTGSYSVDVNILMGGDVGVPGAFVTQRLLLGVNGAIVPVSVPFTTNVLLGQASANSGFAVGPGPISMAVTGTSYHRFNAGDVIDLYYNYTGTPMGWGIQSVTPYVRFTLLNVI